MIPRVIYLFMWRASPDWLSTVRDWLSTVGLAPDPEISSAQPLWRVLACLFTQLRFYFALQPIFSYSSCTNELLYLGIAS